MLAASLVRFAGSAQVVLRGNVQMCCLTYLSMVVTSIYKRQEAYFMPDSPCVKFPVLSTCFPESCQSVSQSVSSTVMRFALQQAMKA